MCYVNILLHYIVGSCLQVLNVILQFYGPFPKALTIQKKTSALSLWETWQLYADDCQAAFNLPNNGSLSLPSSVNCIQFSGLVQQYTRLIRFHLLDAEWWPFVEIVTNSDYMAAFLVLGEMCIYISNLRLRLWTFCWRLKMKFFYLRSLGGLIQDTTIFAIHPASHPSVHPSIHPPNHPFLASYHFQKLTMKTNVPPLSQATLKLVAPE